MNFWRNESENMWKGTKSERLIKFNGFLKLDQLCFYNTQAENECCVVLLGNNSKASSIYSLHSILFFIKWEAKVILCFSTHQFWPSLGLYRKFSSYVSFGEIRWNWLRAISKREKVSFGTGQWPLAFEKYFLNQSKHIDQNGGEKMTRESIMIEEKMDDWNER